jgi:hypothetical protein
MLNSGFYIGSLIILGAVVTHGFFKLKNKKLETTTS